MHFFTGNIANNFYLLMDYIPSKYQSLIYILQYSVCYMYTAHVLINTYKDDNVVRQHH